MDVQLWVRLVAAGASAEGPKPGADVTVVDRQPDPLLLAVRRLPGGSAPGPTKSRRGSSAAERRCFHLGCVLGQCSTRCREQVPGLGLGALFVANVGLGHTGVTGRP